MQLAFPHHRRRDEAARAFREMPLRIALDADQRFGETGGVVVECRRRLIEQGQRVVTGAGEIGIPDGMQPERVQHHDIADAYAAIRR